MATKKKAADFPHAGTKAYQTIIRPIITEKSAAGGGVVFKVNSKATKTEVKEAVESLFKVEVDSVRTCHFVGKKKRVNRSIGKRAGYKKAYISLKPGYSIDVVEGL